MHPDRLGSLRALGGLPSMMVHSGNVCLHFLERRLPRLIGVDYQTQSLEGQKSSASSLANCTPLVTLSPHGC